MASIPRRVAKHRPNPSRELDLQSLKQATACITRALSLFLAEGTAREIAANDATAAAQAALAIRFLEAFVGKRGDGDDADDD
jgi:hypothetical protein